VVDSLIEGPVDIRPWRTDVFANAFPTLEFVKESAATDAQRSGSFRSIVAMLF